MPRIPRWAAWTAAAVLVLAGLVLAAGWLLGRDRARVELETRLTAALGREVSIAGPVSLALRPAPALDLEGLAIAGEGGPLLEIGRLTLDADGAALARGRFALGTVRVERPRLRLALDAAGRGSWEAPARAAPDGGGAPAWSIERLEIVDGRVDWRDGRDGTTASLVGLRLGAGPIRLPGTVPFELAVRSVEYGPTRTRVTARGSLAVDVAAGEFAARGLAVDAVPERAPAVLGPRPGPLRLAAESVAWSSRAGRARLDGVALRGLGLDARLDGELLRSAAPATAAAAGTAADAGVTYHFGGRVGLAPFSPRALLAALGREAPVTQDPAAWTRAALAARIEWSDGALRLRDVDALLDDSRLRGGATVRIAPATRWRFDLAVDRLDAERYREPVDRREAAPVELPVDFLRRLDAEGVLAFDELRVAGVRLAGVRVELDGGAPR